MGFFPTRKRGKSDSTREAFSRAVNLLASDTAGACLFIAVKERRTPISLFKRAAPVLLVWSCTRMFTTCLMDGLPSHCAFVEQLKAST